MEVMEVWQFQSLPPEVCLVTLPSFFGAAQPVGRLAAASRSLNSDLKDSAGRLHVNAIVTCRLHSAMEGLERSCLGSLEVFRLDLSGENREQLARQEIDSAIRQLGNCLSGASMLRVLSVRLASFDMSMERLRLSIAAWEALIRGLGQLARHGRLRSLQLSSITIKTSRATQDVSMPSRCQCAEPLENSHCCLQASNEALLACSDSQQQRSNGRQLRRAASSPTRGSGADAALHSASPGFGTKLTFLQALEQLSSLEELVLTYDEIFGSTAQMLIPVFHKMERLRRVDLTRNHIPKQAMQEVRAQMPPKVELCGDDLQTFFFY